MPRILIAGCGYVGQATADLFHAAGWDVEGWTASEESAARVIRQTVSYLPGRYFKLAIRSQRARIIRCCYSLCEFREAAESSLTGKSI